MADSRIILASSSPRRRQLLEQLGVRHSVEAANIDETKLPEESPAAYVQRMACEKAAVVKRRSSGLSMAVLAADTVVVLDGRTLGKPRNIADAFAMLTSLSDRAHRVLTSVCLCSGELASTCLVSTDVEFVRLKPRVCQAYLATDEPWDKAGGYAIQGLGGAFVKSIRGSYSNVVGLPLAETWQLLRAAGLDTALEMPAEARGEKRGE
ncbi:MAG: septum formation inhibitor Maf [Halioglobus sp.]|nr:septum formation inhibitor Maf [Halioglobus sp.]